MRTIPPFTILALAPFGPVPDGERSPRVIEADPAALDEALAEIAPRFWIELPRELSPEGGVTVAVDRLADFRPENLVGKIPLLSDLLAARDFIRDGSTRGEAEGTVAEGVRRRWPDLPLGLEALAPPSSPARDPEEDDAVDAILAMVATGSREPARRGPGGGTAVWSGEVERRVSECLRRLYADPAFRACEAAWSGARRVARAAGREKAERVRLRLASVSPQSLGDVLAALAVSQAEDAPGLTVVDHPFDNSPWSLEVLEAAAASADGLLAPVAVEFGPAFCGLESWDRLGSLGYLPHALEGAAWAKFRRLRGLPGAAWMCALVNRFLERPPYGPGNPSRPVAFAESGLTWVSPVWGLAALCARSLAGFGWPTRFNDPVQVRLEDLATAEDGHGPLPVAGNIGQEQAAQLAEAGLTPLLGAPGRDFAWIARQTCLGGGSFGRQVFVGRVVAWLLRCRAEDRQTANADPAGSLRQAVADLFEQSGRPAPADLTVEGDSPLVVGFTPPAEILGGERLVLSIA